MLISVEHEMPAVYLDNRNGVKPQAFIDLWGELSKEGWTLDGQFALSRKVSCSHFGAQKPNQMIGTDTGPTVEIAPSPAETISAVDQQLKDIRAIVGTKLLQQGIGLLGSGVHPYLGNTIEEYYRYRTPRLAYDYAIEERGWQHRTILNIAAMQEVVDVPVSKAPSVVSVMHRLAGVFLFINRNDHDLSITEWPLRSIRPRAWRNQMPTFGEFFGDQQKVGIPHHPVENWKNYLHFLWNFNRMFLLGTKSNGLVYVPQHPYFSHFISSDQEWLARRLDTREEICIKPEMSHVKQTDWTYMGFTRLRLFWKDGVNLSDVATAYKSNDATLEGFLSSSLEKVLLENRSSASPPPGEEMCSLALIVGLIENFDAVKRFADARPYEFWLKFASQAEGHPLIMGDKDRILSEVVSLSRTGLLKRGLGEEIYIEPIVRRLKEKKSSSERMFDLHEKGGIDLVVEKLLYHF